MDSFYGGKAGVSFILRQRFTSIEEMIKSFKQGMDYKDVWFEEYCIIDSTNKNNPDNGKLYQRGMDYQNSMGGAIYKGQIVGPSGVVPYMQMNTLTEISNKVTNKYSQYDSDSIIKYPTGYEKDDKGNITGYTVSTNGGGKDLAYFPFSTAHDTSLVPGKDGENYNDEITWTWCNIKDSENSDVWTYIGFQIPYLVNEYSVHVVSNYNDLGNYLADSITIDRVDDGTHPFYQKWDLGLPKGIKGDTLRNLRVITPTSTDKIYDVNSLVIAANGQADISKLVEYAGKDEDVINSRNILVFDYYVYDSKVNPTAITFYIGDYNDIKNVEVADDGTVTISYTHNDDTIFSNILKWVDDVSLTTGNGSQGGHFQVEYNNGSDPYQTDISWIKNVEIADNGTITYTFAGSGDEATNSTTGIKTESNKLKWIDSVTLNPDNGQFTVVYNNGTPDYSAQLDWVKEIQLETNGTLHFIHTTGQDEQPSSKLKWINDVTLNSNTGVFTIQYNYGEDLVEQLNWIDNVYIDESTGEIAIHNVDNSKNTSAANTNRQAAQVLDAKLKLITGASVSASGVTTLQTNTGEDFTLKRSGTQEDYQIKTIDTITLSDAIGDDKHIFVKYNTNDSSIALGNPINYVERMEVRSSDWHLLVLFSDPDHRAKSNELDENNYAYNAATTASYYGTGPWISYGSYDSSIKWRDFGPIKDQSGVLVGFNISYDEVPEDGDIVEYLNAQYPNGLTGSDNQPGGASTQGKIITYGNKDDDKLFYAFDYSEYTWYYLGKVEASAKRDAKLVSGVGTDDERKAISSEGLRFSTYSYSTVDAMPKYWSKTGA
jgi:hypothetical protein